MGFRAGITQMLKGAWRFVTDLGAADPLPPSPQAMGSPPVWASDPGATPGREGPSVSAPISQYDPIRSALDRTLQRFVDNVHEHLIFAPDERFSLRYLTLTGHDAASQALITRFFNEFRDATTQHNIAVGAVQRNCAHGVLTDAQTTLRAELSVAELAPFDLWNAQLAAIADPPEPLSLGIVGEWVKAPTQITAAGTGPAPAAAAAGQVDVSRRQLSLDITDAAGSRSVALASLPITIGKDSAGQPHAMQGKFLSRVHGLLLLEAQQTVVWLNLSGNGSLVDGHQVLRPGERTPLRNGARIALGRTQEQFATAPAECPLIAVRWASSGSDKSATPVTADVGAAGTPLVHESPYAVAGPPPGPLCNLAVQDAEGTRTCPVLALPFTIGRDPDSDCRIPEANKTVSRIHLELVEISDAGARVRNHADAKGWGTAVDGLEQPADFSLPWGATVTLASRDTDGKRAQLQLQKAER